MKSVLLVAMGIVIGATALGVLWAASGASDGKADVRIVVEPVAYGYSEVGLQQRTDDGQWSETIKPQHRFVPPDLELGVLRYSSVFQLDVGSRAESVAEDYRAFLTQSGVETGGRYTERFRRPGRPDEEMAKFLCVVDLNHPGMDAYCDGFVQGYAGPVERIEVSDYDAFREQLETRFTENHDFGGLFATSIQLGQIVDETREAARARLTWSYWIELIDPHLPDPDNLYCVISHGSDEDLFWGLAAESSVAAGGALA